MLKYLTFAFNDMKITSIRHDKDTGREMGT